MSSHGFVRKPGLFSLSVVLVVTTLLPTSPLAAQGPKPQSKPRKVKPGEEVAALLQSLTLPDFERREAVVSRLGELGMDGATSLVEIASDTSGPLHLRARYMLRRCFWELAPQVIEALDSPNRTRRANAEDALNYLMNIHVLEGHQHGGLQKRGILFEQLGYLERALDCYQRWVPPHTGCGNCDASIAHEKTSAILRCYLKLKQTDRAEALCWSLLGKYEEGYNEEIALKLVDLYEARGELDTLSSKLRRSSDRNKPLGKVALEYIAMREDFRGGREKRHLVQVQSRFGPLYFQPEHETWQAQAAARSFAAMGDAAVPLLADRLRSQGLDRGIVYALYLTGSEAAIKPIVAAAARCRDFHGSLLADTLKPFPQESTRNLIPLLDHTQLEVVAYSARMLGEVGTVEAVEPLIQHLDNGRELYWVLWEIHAALVRLTGETAGVRPGREQNWHVEAKKLWTAWWTEHKEEFKVKTAAWWDSAQAVPYLVAILDSNVHDALTRLTKLEHPVLAELIDHENPFVKYEAVDAWERFDPAACVPKWIEIATGSLATPPGRAAPPTEWQPYAQKRLEQLTGVNFQADAQAWNHWWEANRDRVRFRIPDRWW